MIYDRIDEVFRTLADPQRHHRPVNWQISQISQHQIDGHDKITHGVDHRAVKVNDG